VPALPATRGSSGSRGRPGPERLALATSHGVETVDTSQVDDVADALIELTDGRGADGVTDALGMEAHGSPVGKVAHAAVGLPPDALAKPLTGKLSVDRLHALRTSLKEVRRGGRCRCAASTAASWTRCR